MDASREALLDRGRTRGVAILAPLDEAQRAAASAIEGPTLVLAAAGAGKSRVLAHQIAFACAAGRVAPRRILALVSSPEDGEALAQRAARLLGAPLHGAWIGTLRDACLKILRSHAGAVGRRASFEILDESDARTLIRGVARELGVDLAVDTPARLQEAIAAVKTQGVAPTGIVARVFPAYEAALAAANAFDPDDLLHHVGRLLADDEALRRKYRRRFEQIFVDDFQDTGPLQRRLLLLVGGEEGNVHAAADPDAAVTPVTAPEPADPLAFPSLWPSARLFRLETHYRSTKRIVYVAGRLAARNPGLHIPMKPIRRRGQRVVALTAGDEQEEAALVVRWIRRLARRGQALDRMAILVRQPVLLRPFEEALVKERVPYRVRGGPRFYERREIKDTLAYLHLCLPPGSPEALARIANAPRRGIGPASVRTLARIQQQHGVGLAEAAMRAASLPRVTAARAGALADLGRLLNDLEEAARRLGAADLIEYVVERSGYGTLLGELSSASNAETRREGIDELRGIARGFPGFATESLPPLFARVALVGSAPPPAEGVQLMTLAASRGSEVDVVFLSGLEEEVIPSRRAIAAGEAAIQSERRLVYLGMTRARNRLILLSALARTMQGEVRSGAPSRFLEEAGRRVRRFRVGAARAAVRAEAQPGQIAEPLLQVREGQRVSHASWGVGVVVASDGKFVTVRFDEAGEKRLSLVLARLRPA